MIRDYITHELQESLTSIDQLQVIEQDLKGKRGRDRRDIEQSAEQKRQSIINKTHSSSAIYQFLATTKEAEETAFRTEWQSLNIKVDCLESMKRHGLANLKNLYEKIFQSPEINLQILPNYSFVLQFTFELSQPYISRDEQDFYIIDNPVRKDKVFGLPYIASTSWKGSLRAALWQLGHKAQEDTISRLFGNEPREEKQEQLHAGRLNFFPTFFMLKSLEIINPHDREQRVGKNPITIESVPSEAKGNFTLLYVPFDRVGQDEAETRKQVATELQLVVEGLQTMFRIYGFGAKTSSGFGLAKEIVFGGSLKLRAVGMEDQKKEAEPITPSPTPSLPRYLEAPNRLKPEYLTKGGTFRERSDSELKKMSKGDRQIYDKAKIWWERETKRLAEVAQQVEEVEPSTLKSQQAKPINWPSWPFNNFEQLLEHTNGPVGKLVNGDVA